MKDKLIRLMDRLYNKAYRILLKVTYLYLSRKKCKHSLPLTRQEKKEIKRFWRQYGVKHVPLYEYGWYKKHTGKVCPQMIPDVIWHSRIEPYYNNVIFEKSFQDKNYFETIIDSAHLPKTVLRCINGVLLNSSYAPLTMSEAQRIISGNELICKPALDTGGGRGITFLKKDEPVEIVSLLEQYHGNFVVQEIIRQHKQIAAFNPDSVNTIRIVTLIENGKVNFLAGCLRVGASGENVDNIARGGYFVELDENGHLDKNAYVKDLKTRDYLIKEDFCARIEKIPSWSEIWRVVEETHFKLCHFKLINWDVALREDGVPVLIEYNLIDSSPTTHQIQGKPILGELTDTVLSRVLLKR